MAKDKLERFKGMLPLYVKGDLPGSEKKELEQALEKFPELQQELRDYGEVRDSYREIAQAIPEPADNLYDRIIHNIRRQETAKALEKERAWFHKLSDFMRYAFASPRLAWAMASFLLVISLVVISKPNPGIYITLGDIKTDPNMIQLNIVFKEDASEKEIRDLLLKTGTQIVDGPDAGGLYVLSIKMVDQKEIVLKAFQKAAIVRMAEMRY